MWFTPGVALVWNVVVSLAALAVAVRWVMTVGHVFGAWRFLWALLGFALAFRVDGWLVPVGATAMAIELVAATRRRDAPLEASS